MTIFFSLISLILGLHFLKDDLFVSIVLTLLFVIFIIYRFKWKKNVLFITLFLFGALFTHLPRVYNNEENIYSGVIISAKENYFLLYSHGERFYVSSKDNGCEIGDFVSVHGEVSNVWMATYESQFDFNSYLKNKGVQRQINSFSIKPTFQNPIRLKRFKLSIIKDLNLNAAPLVEALLFNTKDYQSNVVSIADTINLIFLLSTAGIYFSFFIRTLKRLIYLKLEERESHFLSLLIVSPYVLFSFPKVGVLRVFLVNLLGASKKEGNSDKKSSFLTRLSLAHLLLLIINPYWAFDSGFLLGLFLTTSLYFFRISYRTKISFKSKMVTPTLVFLFVQPLFVLGSGSFHLFTYFEQIIFIPLIETFIILSILFMIGIPLGNVINFLGNFIYETFKMFEQIDLKIPLAGYTSVFIPVFYLLFMIGIYLFESQRFKHLKYCCITAIGMLLIGLVPIQPLISSGVYFINVGQGDSIVIQDHFHAVMIDTGGNISFDMAQKTLIPFLNKKHIYHLDALITTHDDFDHYGAKDSLLKHFIVRNYLTQKEDFPYQIGNISLVNLNVYDAEQDNDNSLVLYSNFYGKKYLFTGDAPKSIETKIIQNHPELTCDILKVGHHGSKTSSDDSFIKQLHPKEAIISCGRNNRYGHPNKEVIDVLNKYDVKIRRTDYEGTISYLSYFVY